MEIDDRLLTAAEIADRVQVSADMIRSWTKRGLIPCVRPNRRTTRYFWPDVLLALKRGDEQVMTVGELAAAAGLDPAEVVRQLDVLRTLPVGYTLYGEATFPDSLVPVLRNLSGWAAE